MLSHVDARNRPAMVDIGGKDVTRRSARASARISLPAAVLELFRDGDLQGPKGPVFQTAIIAGTMAVKRTHELIPFCHPLAIDGCRIEIGLEGGGALVECEVRVEHRTGVEMEALTGATVAALTIYDMCKAVSHEMVISDVRLLAKTGGKCDLQP
jgi:cyclic pyranopterin phosphate synthase